MDSPATDFSAERIVSLLHEAGYRAQIHSETLVASATAGMRFLLSANQKGWLQFALSLRNGGEMDLTGVNEFNRKYRFCRLYLDAEGDMVLEADYYLFGDLQPVFAEYMSVWDDMVAALVLFVRGRTPSPAGGSR